MLEWITSVSFTKKNKGRSMRTTIPLGVVELLELKEYDKIRWIYDKKKDVIFIKKV